MKTRNSSSKGFTLVEIMIVVVIIGLLAAMAIPAFQKVRVASQDKAVLNNARQMAAAADQYYLEYGVSTTVAANLIGANALSIAVSALQEGSNTKSCDLAKLSVDNFTLVNVMVPGAGAANREQAGQLMQNAMQYGPMADNLVKQLKCK